MVDDLLATGGTMEAALRLVRRIGGNPVACSFVIELGFLNGKKPPRRHSRARVDPGLNPARPPAPRPARSDERGSMTRKNTNAQRKDGPERDPQRETNAARASGKSAARNRKPIAPELESLSTRAHLGALPEGAQGRTEGRGRAREAAQRAHGAVLPARPPTSPERLLQTLPKSIELDDLVSAGLFGLMDAIRGFDHARNIKFKTYCTTRIRGSILDQLRSQDWVPRLVRLKAGRIEKALQRLTGEYGREPTHAELASDLDLQHERTLHRDAERERERPCSRSRTSGRTATKTAGSRRSTCSRTGNRFDPIGELHRRDMLHFLTRSLTHKERFIIEQYYHVGHTMREIGEMLALTESRVCQITAT